MKLNKFITQILFLRPYSFIGIISIVVLADVIINAVTPFSLLVDSIAGLLLWMIAIFIGEYFHFKLDHRRLPAILLLFAVALFLIIVLLNEPKALSLFVAMLILCLAYANKSRVKLVSPISFLIRGFLEVIIFLTIVLFHSHSLIGLVNYWPQAILIYLITASRNLVGDVRDMKYDKYTFPTIFGKKMSYVVSITLIILSFIITPTPFILLPLLPIILLLLIDFPPYLLHAAYVISTFAVYLNYTIFLLNEKLIFLFLTNLFFAGNILILTYFFTPRRANVELRRLLR